MILLSTEPPGFPPT